MDMVISLILLLIGLFMIVFVVANPPSATVNVSDFNVSCIQGVEYWYGQSGYKGYMSPRIDPETLAFVRCDD
jgi:hypothetical protein